MADDHAGGDGAEPVWAGGADAFQLRLAHAPRDLRAQFVNATGTATRGAARRHRAAARGARRVAALAGEPARAQDAHRRRRRSSRARQWGAAACGPPRFAATYGDGRRPRSSTTRSTRTTTARRTRAAIVRAICRYHRSTKRLARHRLQLPRRPLRPDLRRPRGRDRPGRDRRPGAGLQRRLDRRREHRHVQRRRRRRRTRVHAMAELLAWKLSLHGVPVTGQVTRALARRPDQPLPRGHAGDVRAHLRPSRRRRDDVPRRRALRPAAGDPPARGRDRAGASRPPTRPRRARRSRSRPPTRRSTTRSPRSSRAGSLSAAGAPLAGGDGVDPGRVGRGLRDARAAS